MQRAKVFRNSIFAGILTKLNEKEYIFVYDKEYLKMPNKKAISLTLPLQEEEFKSPFLFPFFYNLLAEGKLKGQTFDISALQTGVYYIIIETAEGSVVKSKFIKK